MPKLTYAENPVHPLLNDFPSALVPASVAFDMLHLITRRPTFKNAAFWTLLMAFGTGTAAAATGLEDYREIPEGTEEKRLANAHALLNLALLGAIGLQLPIRLSGRVGITARLLNLGATAGLMAASWYGTTLVYRHGVRVRGVDPSEDQLPADDQGRPIADRLEKWLELVPDTDLTKYVTQASDAATIAGRQAQETLDEAARTLNARAEEVRRQLSGPTEGSPGPDATMDDAEHAARDATDAARDAGVEVSAMAREAFDEPA
jgi:uncharacterized membrane protein